ncbi:MAG: phage holin family protein, partial [Prevotella sp.]|nr:phage holin family protein [Prevotella sp.]
MMKTLTIFCSLLLSTTSIAFLGSSLDMMIPWLMVMAAVVFADLAAGIRKSLKLGVRVTFSSACRETFGKLIVYSTIVLFVCMLDVASDGSGLIAKWACMFVMILEGGSIISNLLRPYGIIVTPKSILKWFLKKSPANITDEEAEELLK